jgi:hypothetical protein
MSQIKKVLNESVHPETLASTFTIRSVAIEELATIEETIAKLEADRDRIKSMFTAEMTAANISSIETDRLTVTYVAPRVTTTFDSKRFKEEQGSLYDMYTRPSSVKESLRISWKASATNKE